MTPSDRPESIRVTLADESELVWRGLRSMMAPYADIVVVPPAPGGNLSTVVDVTLYDASEAPSLDRLRELANDPANGCVVLWTWSTRQRDVGDALLVGARGCLAKSLPGHRLVEALRLAASGRTVFRRPDDPTSQPSDELAAARLTLRESEIIGLIATGVSNADIVDLTRLSINSVKSYIRTAYRKMGVTTRSQAVLWAVRNGCVPGHDETPGPASVEAGPALRSVLS